MQAELEEIFLIRMTNNRKKFEGQSSSRSYCTLDTVWDLILWFSLLQVGWVNNSYDICKVDFCRQDCFEEKKIDLLSSKKGAIIK